MLLILFSRIASSCTRLTTFCSNTDTFIVKEKTLNISKKIIQRKTKLDGDINPTAAANLVPIDGNNPNTRTKSENRIQYIASIKDNCDFLSLRDTKRNKQIEDNNNMILNATDISTLSS